MMFRKKDIIILVSYLSICNNIELEKHTCHKRTVLPVFYIASAAVRRVIREIEIQFQRQYLYL